MRWKPTLNWTACKTALDLIAWGVALAALIIGFLHVSEIKKTAKDLNAFRDSLETNIGKVQSSLSTQFAGSFPDFLDDVIRTISDAQHTLVILCDFPGYADYSEPKRAAQIRALIEQKLLSGVKVQFMCLNQRRRTDALHMQFPKKWFDNEVRTPAGRNALEQYCGILPSAGTALTYDAFLAANDAKDQLVLKQVLRNANVVEVDDDIPMFFWIADERHGVMAVQTLGGQNEYGFRTSDQSLINALSATRDRYVPAATVRPPK